MLTYIKDFYGELGCKMQMINLFDRQFYKNCNAVKEILET